MPLMDRDPRTCKSFVEMVTDYLENELPAHVRESFEEHRGECPGCEVYFDQIETTIRVLAKTVEDRVDSGVRSEVLAKLTKERR